ncbi:VapC toxin family PIN domain ribonuclease [Georgenia yuyongxinii]|uniref:Ribonuclease VapC n=1 Tax=Georgenia yuyongxinii TaxID=2589797 RepID=A0A5B8C7L2_9MICO|nr:TA system VapC family ribonuclease toxin [Georgenia yuyongxinii]QDC25162.1 VapC toxin family PIN domain ribonuclease [Georgenia yuyongxinii]
MPGAETTRLLDVNVLVALTNPTHIRHESAHRWLARLPDSVRWATTPMTEASFIRLMTNPAVAGQDVTASAALDVLAQMRDVPDHVFVPDDSSLAVPHIDLTALVGHQQVTDFHLVNLAAATGAVLATFDTRIASALAPTDRHHVETIDGETAAY